MKHMHADLSCWRPQARVRGGSTVRKSDGIMAGVSSVGQAAISAGNVRGVYIIAENRKDMAFD